MKTVRIFSVALAVVLLVAAVVPFTVTPAVAQKNSAVASAGSASKNFVDAAVGAPLLAPMRAGAPSISVSVEQSTASSYGCTLVSQSPSDWAKVKSRQDFDMAWTVRNTGDAIWPALHTSFAYVSGAKLQTRDSSFDLTSSIAKGQKLKLSVDMEAPKNVGTYTTLWALYAGKTRFCRLTLILTVTK